MRKALPCAAGVVVSFAMLGFVLRHGLEISKPDDAAEFAGWQFSAMRWGLLGAALGLGLIAAVWAHRQSRRMAGEGVVFVPPAVLAGLLLSGVTSAAASPAESWAARQTPQYRQAIAQERAWLAEEKVRPLPVPMHNFPPPTPGLVALVPTLSDLGPGWYDGQVPSVVGWTGAPGAQVRFVQATRTRSGDGWDFQRTLSVRLREYSSSLEASRALTSDGGGSVTYVPERVRGLVFQVRALDRGGAIAVARRGVLVWSVWLTSGQPSSVIPPAEREALLAVVAARVVQ